jgi:acyl carrier protein
MIDLAGLLDEYAGADDIEQILRRRLSSDAPAPRQLERFESGVVSEGVDHRGLMRSEGGRTEDADVFDRMSGEALYVEPEPISTTVALGSVPPPERLDDATSALTGRVRRIISEQLGVDLKDVTLDSRLGDDLGSDGLGAIELVLAVEETFDLDIADEDLVTIGLVTKDFLSDSRDIRVGPCTVRQIVEYLQHHVEAQ